jgi:hypothetical protein
MPSVEPRALTTDLTRGSTFADRYGRLSLNEVADRWLDTRTRARPEHGRQYRSILATWIWRTRVHSAKDRVDQEPRTSAVSSTASRPNRLKSNRVGTQRTPGTIRHIFGVHQTRY